MLRELIDIKNEKNQGFQVMLLQNDTSDDVEVHETETVDYLRIQEHLNRGGSVFITSKASQKLDLTLIKKRKTPRNRLRTLTAFYFDHV